MCGKLVILYKMSVVCCCLDFSELAVLKYAIVLRSWPESVFRFVDVHKNSFHSYLILIAREALPILIVPAH